MKTYININWFRPLGGSKTNTSDILSRNRIYVAGALAHSCPIAHPADRVTVFLSALLSSLKLQSYIYNTDIRILNQHVVPLAVGHIVGRWVLCDLDRQSRGKDDDRWWWWWLHLRESGAGWRFWRSKHLMSHDLICSHLPTGGEHKESFFFLNFWHQKRIYLHFNQQMIQCKVKICIFRRVGGIMVLEIMITDVQSF